MDDYDLGGKLTVENNIIISTIYRFQPVRGKFRQIKRLEREVLDSRNNL